MGVLGHFVYLAEGIEIGSNHLTTSPAAAISAVYTKGPDSSNMFLHRAAPLFRRCLSSKATELAPSFLTDLRSILGVDRVATGFNVCAQHGQDAGPHTGKPPQAVVWPETREQVHRVQTWKLQLTNVKGFGHLPTVQQCRSASGAGWECHRPGRRDRGR